MGHISLGPRYPSLFIVKLFAPYMFVLVYSGTIENLTE